MASRSRSTRASLPSSKKEYLEQLGISGVNPGDAVFRHENYAVRTNRKAFSEYLDEVKNDISGAMKIAMKVGSSQSGSLTMESDGKTMVLDKALVKSITSEILNKIDRVYSIAYASRPNFDMDGVRLKANPASNRRLVEPAVIDFINDSAAEFGKKYGITGFSPIRSDDIQVESRDLQNFITVMAEQVVDDGKHFVVSQALYDLLQEKTIGFQEKKDTSNVDNADKNRLLEEMGLKAPPKKSKVIYTRFVAENDADRSTGIDIITERLGLSNIRVGDHLPVSIASVIVSFYSEPAGNSSAAFVDLKPFVSQARDSSAYQKVLETRRARKEAAVKRTRKTTTVRKGRSKSPAKAATSSKSRSPRAASSSPRPKSRSPRGGSRSPRSSSRSPARCVAEAVESDGVFSSSSSSARLSASPARRR